MAAGVQVGPRELSISHCKPWAEIVLQMDNALGSSVNSSAFQIGRLEFAARLDENARTKLQSFVRDR